jgi:hypothetical protein
MLWRSKLPGTALKSRSRSGLSRFVLLALVVIARFLEKPGLERLLRAGGRLRRARHVGGSVGRPWHTSGHRRRGLLH